MRKLLQGITLAILFMAGTCDMTQANAHPVTICPPTVVAVGGGTTFVSTLLFTGAVGAYLGAVYLIAEGYDPWHPIAQEVFGDSGQVSYDYPTGKNGSHAVQAP